MKRQKVTIVFNAPVVLAFALLCLAALLLNKFTMGAANNLVFSTYRSSLTNPLTYVRFFGHVLGHSGWDHLAGNMLYILLLGPMIEEKYGSSRTLQVILITALTTGIINFIFFPRVVLCGASGVCFAFILLSSITGSKRGEIPVTFILVAIIFLGQQVMDGIFLKDNISNLSHIIGGLIGAIYGFIFGRRGYKS